ncbi:MAG: hypothetical protein DMG88_07855 [Acidobacteria bacterium]|nr:MAG: hypothetical protein DMG88_07855 [Acidobacteriota bacterium]
MRLRQNQNLDEMRAAMFSQRFSYAIICYNVQTYESGGVVEVVKSRQNAETTMKELQDCQSSEHRQEGWRYFFERTTLEPGTDPAEATQRRQMDLEVRESKAVQQSNSSPELARAFREKQ